MQYTGFSLSTLLCSLAATYRHTQTKWGTHFIALCSFHSPNLLNHICWNHPSIYLSGPWTHLMNCPHCHSSVMSKHILSYISPLAISSPGSPAEGALVPASLPNLCLCLLGKQEYTSTRLASPLKTTMLYCAVPGLK